MIIDADYFRELETPRLAVLAKNLMAASFPIMKLMPARYMLDRAAASGELKTNGHIVETTSGTFGMAVALLSAARNYRLDLVTASSLIDPRYQQRLEFLGARIIVVDDPGADGNQRGRLDQIDRLIQDDPDAFWTRQYDSDWNWLAYARLAERFVQAAGPIDWLVGCVGSGGSLCGTGVFLRSLYPDLRITAVDTHRSVLFGHPIGKRLLRGLGNSILPRNLRHDVVDEVHWVGAYHAWQSCHRLLRHKGLFVGPTSGAAGLVASWIAHKHPDARVAVIMPDEGYRYSDTIFDLTWLQRHPGWLSELSTDPIPLSTIGPHPETDWTCFPWARRHLEDVLAQDAGSL